MSIQKGSRLRAAAGAGMPFAMGLLAAVVLTASSAHAVTCIVTSTADNGAATLRANIANTACDTIIFNVTGVITLESGLPAIARNLTITGPGGNMLTVQQDPAQQFTIMETDSGTVAISGLTFANGGADPNHVYVDVGGIHNGAANLTVSNVIFANNGGTVAGAIWNEAGALTITNSTFNGNTTGNYSGAIEHDSNGSLTITGSTFNGNQAYGGATISVQPPSHVDVTVTGSTFSGNLGTQAGVITCNSCNATISNSTFSGNQGVFADVIQNFASPMTITNSTFSGNSGIRTIYNDGAALMTITNSTFAGNQPLSTLAGSSITLKNTILAGIPITPSSNTLYPPCGSVTDGGGNISYPGTSCPGLNVNPQLGPLANNGGATQTMSIPAGSPAVNAAILANCPASDQRGVSRPQGNGCDIGAYELIDQAYGFTGFFAPVSNAPSVNVVKAGQAIPIIFTLGGNWGLNILTDAPGSQPVACGSSLSYGTVTDTVTAGNSSFSYNSATGLYTYVWKTDKAWANTCRRLIFNFNDAALTIGTANFSFSQ